MTEKEGKASTGDDRIWDQRLKEALDLIDRGNNYRARQILTSLRDEAPDQALRDSAREALKGISVDPWFYVIWGLSAAVAAAIFVYYILLR
jgi:hypothetical protein